MRTYRVIPLISLLFSCVAQAAVPSDFDGDGVSDRVRVEVGSDKALTWKAVLSSTGETRELGQLGKEGDQLIMGQWLSTTEAGKATQIGTASLDAGTGSVTWSILDAAGNRASRVFGKKGDLVVAGGDFNGNGIGDAAVVRLIDGRAQWQIAYDLFMSESVAPVAVTFGEAGDRAFFLRRAGSTADSIAVIRKGTGRRSVARVRNLLTGEVRQFTRMPAFASTGSRPRAFPIRQATGDDLLGFVTTSDTASTARVFTLAGAEVAQADFAGTGEALVGDFSAAGGYEVAFSGAKESGVFIPASAEVVEVPSYGGIAVDEINVATIGGTVAADSSGGSGGGNSGGGGAIAACSETMSWPGSHIYKTMGSEHFSDIRRNTIGVVIKPGGRGPFPSCVDVVTSSGAVVAKLGIYEKGGKWAARYYAGIGCGAGTPFNGSGVASRARAQSGSSSVYMNFGGICYGPIEASRCIGSNQC